MARRWAGVDRRRCRCPCRKTRLPSLTSTAAATVLGGDTFTRRLGGWRRHRAPPPRPLKTRETHAAPLTA